MNNTKLIISNIIFINPYNTINSCGADIEYDALTVGHYAKLSSGEENLDIFDDNFFELLEDYVTENNLYTDSLDLQVLSLVSNLFDFQKESLLNQIPFKEASNLSIDFRGYIFLWILFIIVLICWFYFKNLLN